MPYTITLLIEDVGDELEISVVSEVVTGVPLPAGQADQRTRRQVPTHKNGVKDQKKIRRNPNHRHADVIGPHLPLFLINHSGPADDIVVFQCTFAFVVDVSLDPGFDPPTGANPGPLNPFGWSTPQSGGPSSSVTGMINKASFPPGADRMDFYKCTVWCNGKKLDPDFICESGL